MSWSVVCSPKAQGGLGLRGMEEFNQALIMKLGWALISKRDSLWVRVIRGKYSCGDATMLVVCSKRCESEAWKGIRKTWDWLVQGLIWQVGDGSTVRFWIAKWLVSGVVLGDVVTTPIPESMLGYPVSYFFDEAIGWKVRWFVEFLPPTVVTEIISSPGPTPSNGPDVPSWGETSDGLFSTKSAYDLLCGAEQRSPHEAV